MRLLRSSSFMYSTTPFAKLNGTSSPVQVSFKTANGPLGKRPNANNYGGTPVVLFTVSLKAHKMQGK